MPRRKKSDDFFDSIVEEAKEEMRTGQNAYQAFRDVGAAADILNSRREAIVARVVQREVPEPGRILNHPKVTVHGFELELGSRRE